MSRRSPHRYSRREIIEAGLLAGAGLGLARAPLAHHTSDPRALIERAIPSTKEKLPVVGLGTNNYSVTAAEDLASRREVLRRMPDLGGRLVDTAPAYGRSESVIGELVAELGNRDELFLATKVTAENDDTARAAAMFEDSFRRLRTGRIDLMQVHNLTGAEALMPLLRKWQDAKRIRYTGITTSNAAQYAPMAELMRRHPLDFIQVDYSIANRGAAQQVLPLARERGMAVLVNMPLGGRRGGNLIARLSGRPLPEWAADIDAASWPQVLLKYVISHPAVTCAIPGTTKLAHLEDNQQAARGRLPDEALRNKMEQYWDATLSDAT
ncbi:MAG TPA: aldo/keto reductase [Steroidobacteraceae bacterium]|nr:aldo/keto reductase [Steroidobacteraceae bacterium]